MKGCRRSVSRASLAAALALLVALALVACGGSTSTTTAPSMTTSPSTTASPSTSLSVTTLPSPATTGTSTTTHIWSAGDSPVAAATFPPQKGTTDIGEASFGWEFKPTVDIEVTDLGYFDDAGDGLLHPHPVGIFDVATEELLVEATVQPQSPLDGSYRYAKITPVVLKAGGSYRVACYAMPPFDPEVNFPQGLVWAPEIEYVDFIAEEGAKSLEYPELHEPYLWMTPNFKFRPVSAASTSTS